MPEVSAGTPSADPNTAPVVVRFAALGDVVLLTVLIEALHRRYGQRVNVLGSSDWTRQLLQNDPAVGEVRLVSSRRAPHWLVPSRWAADAWLRRQRGPIYLCDPDVYAERIVAHARVPEARMVRAWRHWPGDGIHWADWWVQVARLDAAALPGPSSASLALSAQPRLHATAAWHADARQWLQHHGLAGRPIVLLQPGHKKTHKRGRVGTQTHDKFWPAERWAAVARGVAQSLPGAAVLVCGSRREAGLVEEVIRTVGPLPHGGRVFNAAAHDFSLPRLVGMAALAHSMISVDTGPAHVAAAMDCPLVVLFGRFGWRRWKPRAPVADVRALGPEAPSEAARVLDITVDEVLAAWRALAPRSSLGLPAPADQRPMSPTESMEAA